MKKISVVTTVIIGSIMIFSAFSFRSKEDTVINLKKDNATIPSVIIKTLNGKPVSSQSIVGNKNATLVVFWATCCAPCINELSTISKVYGQWKEETGINVVAVSVDLPEYANGVAPFVSKNNWSFDIYLDVERNLMHKMNAQHTPHSFLIDKNGKVLWQKQGFVSGDEKLILDKINAYL